MPVRGIFRNAFWLYCRLAVITVADLLSVRLLTKALGLDDYGLFAAISGAYLSLLLFNGTLQTTAQRFLAYEIGQDRRDGLATAFASLCVMTFFVCLLICGVGYTAGSWFIDHRLMCSADLGLVHQVFGLGVVCVVCRTACVPFVSALVATERMNYLARIAILEAVLSLSAAFGVGFVERDRLVLYLVFLMIGESIMLFTYLWLCRAILEAVREVRGIRLWNKFREVLGFMSWTSTNALANVMRYQGVCMLLSSVAGSLYAASWNVAMKIGFNLYGLVGGLQQAYCPQIVKRWSSGEIPEFRSLVRQALSWSLLIQSLLALPLLIWTEPILHLIVSGDLPPEAVAFTRCVAVHFLFDSLVGPLDTAVEATGRIARYMVTVSVLSALGFVFAAVCLHFGLPAWTAVASVAATNILALSYRLLYVRLHLGVVFSRLVCNNNVQ